MVLYECFRCGYNTKLKGNIKHHLNRKNICSPILEDVSIEYVKKQYGIEIFKKQHLNDTQTTPKQHLNDTQTTPKLLSRVCKYCNKSFTRKSGLIKHLNICLKKKDTELLINNQNEEIIKMKKEIDELKNFKIQTQNNTTNNTCNNTSNNNSHNNTNMSKNIIINNYGDENIKHLKYKDYVDILSSKYMCVPNLIEKIHFDSEHPENQNIKYTNKKEPYLKIMKNNKWQFVNKKNELLNLIDDKCFILKEKYYKILEKKKYNITENQREKIEEFMEKYKEDDKQVMLDLIQRTELMLLNNN